MVFDRQSKGYIFIQIKIKNMDPFHCMWLAINKKNPEEFHSFTWTQDGRLIINGIEVNEEEWDRIWVEQTLPC
jgi:hypothetical protein